MISMIQFRFPQIDKKIHMINMTSDNVFLKRFYLTYMSSVSLCYYNAFHYGYRGPACSNFAQDFSVPTTFIRL